MKGYRQCARQCCLLPYFYAREERLERAEQAKGADPRTEQTTREADWSEARYDERKDDLDEIVRGA